MSDASAAATSRLALGVLISGRGTNLQALLACCDDAAFGAEVRAVICNRPDAPGLAFGQAHGVPTYVMARGDYPSRVAQQQAMTERLVACGVDLVVLAGFDQILAPAFVAAFAGQMINLHPSLLPAFGGGMHAVRDALEYGAKVTGCTVHFVTDDLDAGPIILQEAVPVEDGDTEATLHARIQEVEHRLLPLAIQLYAQGRLWVEGRRVRVLPPDPGP